MHLLFATSKGDVTAKTIIWLPDLSTAALLRWDLSVPQRFM